MLSKFKFNMIKQCSVILCFMLLSYQVHAEQAVQQQKQIPNCICTKQWEPVCGVNGRTYGNLCEAHCAKVEVVHEGPCSRER